ncbi:ankyrin repeat and LEM domain-containing protein 2 homolog [Chrysoperla carnea]|uniref:ankyrin repeat and LEM domain-containing protein 2 homolog n=1 Tax=Chrysoperla carnea TaxID=189513 RepID=UPI001D098148|nr:ankyrin repeat and LEM domain-containing protein 2 homolog [Chrysoperla carnea]
MSPIEFVKNQTPLLNQHITCIIQNIINTLQKRGENSRGENNNTEDECKSSWNQGDKCKCTWERNMFKQRNNTRKSLKRGGFQRYQRSTSESSDLSPDVSRRLIFNENKKGETEDLLTDDSNLSSDDEDVFYTPPSSPTGSVKADSDDEMLDVTDEGAVDVFLDGNHPTKTDAHVYYAIRDIPIQPTEYPNIYRWKHSIQLYTDDERSKWSNSSRYFQHNTPTTPPRYTNLNNSCSSVSPMSQSWARITGIHNSPITSKLCHTPSSTSSTASRRLWKKEN